MKFLSVKSPHEAYFYQSKAVRMGDWKLMASGRGVKGKQLFNLAKDIGEKNNVAAENPEIVKKLTAVLEQFKAEMKAEGRPPGKL